MYDWQLERILKSDPYTATHFHGVYPIDCLPRVLSFPAAIIANTHPSEKSGEHWVAFYFSSKAKGDFFDSYGHAPKTLDPAFRRWMQRVTSQKAKLQYNQRRVQGPWSSVCGHYCLYFLLLKARGVTSEDIIQSLGPEPLYSDFVVKHFIDCNFSAISGEVA